MSTPFETVYLHVGVEKTGTTSIQVMLDTHREAFAEAGYYYPELFAVGLNTRLAAMFDAYATAKPTLNAVLQKYGGTQALAHKTLEAELLAECEGVNAPNLILSSEFLGAYADVPALLAFCNRLAARTVVVLYIREPASMLLSLESTAIKAGSTEFNVYDNVLDGKTPVTVDYAAMIQRFEGNVAPENLVVRVFERDTLHEGDVTADFLHAIAFPGKAGDFPVERRNESLSALGVDALRVLNSALPAMVDGARNPARHGLVEHVMAVDAEHGSGKLTLPDNVASALDDRVAKSLEWVRQAYFPDRETLFASRKVSKPSDAITPDMRESFLARVLARISDAAARRRSEDDQRVEEATQKASHYRDTADALKAERKSARKAIADQKASLAAAAATAAATTKTLARIRSERETAKSLVADLQAERDAAQALAIERGRVLEAERKSLKTISAKLTKSQTLVTDLQKDRDGAKALFAERGKDLEATRKDLKALSGKLKVSQALVRSLQSERDTAQALVVERGKALDDLRKSFQNLSKADKARQSLVTSLKAERDAARSAVGTSPSNATASVAPVPAEASRDMSELLAAERAKALFFQGDALWLRGKLNEARDAFAGALELDSGNPEYAGRLEMVASALRDAANPKI